MVFSKSNELYEIRRKEDTSNGYDNNGSSYSRCFGGGCTCNCDLSQTQS